MTATWSPGDLRRLDAASELEIAVERPDGSLRRPVPIWVVSAAGQVYVRTWYRRDTGWFGQALRSDGGAGSMVTADATASTLRLDPR